MDGGTGAPALAGASDNVRPTRSWPWGDLPMFGYRVILADPAWDFDGGGNRNARTKYPTMSPADIMALPVGDLASGSCALFLWATDPLLDVAIETMKRWGFRYVTVAFTWAKRTKRDAGWHMGTGYYTRANPEICLLGMTGEMGLPASRGIRQLIVEPLREHSRKPDRVRADIEAMFPGPYLELFARSRRPGWDSWGNEPDKYEEAAPAVLQPDPAHDASVRRGGFRSGRPGASSCIDEGLHP